MWDKIKFFLSDTWIFLKPFVMQMLSDSGRVLARSALQAVTAVARNMLGADNDAKRQAAFDMILQDMKTAGIDIATSTINAALEAAVVKLKASN